MKKLIEVQTEVGFISLSKLTGKQIKDIIGHVSMEFDEPTFQLFQIILEDNTIFWCEGEHDMPYLTDGYGDNAAKFNSEELQSLYDEENGD